MHRSNFQNNQDRMAGSPLIVVAQFDDSKPALQVVVDERSVCISKVDDNIEQSPKNCTTISKISKLATFDLNPVAFCALLSEISNSALYRNSFVRNMSKGNDKQVVIQLRGPWNVPIDRDWNNKISVNIREMVEMDNLMAILSTLGGGYSSLGDDMQECAKIAGRISQKQMSIALRLGDPILMAKCKVYMAISLLQQGKLKTSKQIIIRVYEFATSLPEAIQDPRLKKMCLGVWAKLQYSYKQRATCQQALGSFDPNDRFLVS